MTSLKFFGGVNDYEHGELGGVQLLIQDAKGIILLDIGQRPDHSNRYYSFPYRPKTYNFLSTLETLQLYPNLPGLFRYDYEAHRNQSILPQPIDGILITHPHYDHVGGLTLVRADLPVYMHPDAKKILYLWQYTSGRTINQFIDLYDQFTRVLNNQGKERFLKDEEAIIPRDIRLFQQDPFKISELQVTPFPVDHSTPGSNGFIIETSAGKIGISGDLRLRGRFPERTEAFVEALEKADLSYLIWEGSLLHFEHQGTEADVKEITKELMKDRSLVMIAYPPRDFDRITSLYEAAKSQKRMLLVSPSQALGLKLFNGAHGYPRLDWKYIGVYVPKKRKGLIDENFPEHLIEQDYFEWEQRFLDLHWQSHQSKLQRPSIKDIKDNQDQFLVYMPFNQLQDFLEGIKPDQKSRYIRSHPAPWTQEMELQESQLIEVLKAHGIYEGPQKDSLNTETRRLHQVHITGHLNRRETRDLLRRIKCPIIPYHCMNPQDFVTDVASHTRVIATKRLEELFL
jgi:mRNA degradation ribonuclease J1/J2